MDAIGTMIRHTVETAGARDLIARLEARQALEAMPPTDAYAIPEPPPVRPHWLPPAAGPWGYVGVDYQEHQPATYRGVILDYTDALGQDYRWRFYSGEFERDMTRARRYLVGLACRWGQSSSVSNFIIDRNNAEHGGYYDD